jgi:hypothetical protein
VSAIVLFHRAPHRGLVADVDVAEASSDLLGDGLALVVHV